MDIKAAILSSYLGREGNMYKNHNLENKLLLDFLFEILEPKSRRLHRIIYCLILLT